MALSCQGYFIQAIRVLLCTNFGASDDGYQPSKQHLNTGYRNDASWPTDQEHDSQYQTKIISSGSLGESVDGLQNQIYEAADTPGKLPTVRFPNEEDGLERKRFI